MSETLNPETANAPIPQARRGVKQILLSYFYWTYPRGCFHYDVMVTMILLFIFITPWLWNYGDKPSIAAGPLHPIQVTVDGEHGLILTVQASDVNLDPNTKAPYRVVKKTLRKAIEPVEGDDVFVERWETVKDPQGNVAWRVWAHH